MMHAVTREESRTEDLFNNTIVVYVYWVHEEEKVPNAYSNLLTCNPI